MINESGYPIKPNRISEKKFDCHVDTKLLNPEFKPQNIELSISDSFLLYDRCIKFRRTRCNWHHLQNHLPRKNNSFIQIKEKNFISSINSRYMSFQIKDKTVCVDFAESMNPSVLTSNKLKVLYKKKPSQAVVGCWRGQLYLLQKNKTPNEKKFPGHDTLLNLIVGL